MWENFSGSRNSRSEFPDRRAKGLAREKAKSLRFDALRTRFSRVPHVKIPPPTPRTGRLPERLTVVWRRGRRRIWNSARSRIQPDKTTGNPNAGLSRSPLRPSPPDCGAPRRPFAEPWSFARPSVRADSPFLATEPRSGTSRYDSLRFRHRRKAKEVGKARKPQVARAPSERAKESPCQNSVPWPKTGAFAARPVARPTARRAQPGPPSSVRQPPEKCLDENRPEETPEPRTHPGAAREKPRPERKKGERGRAEAKAGPELGLAGTSRTEPGRARAEAELGPAWPGRDRSRIVAGLGLKSG